MSRKETLLKYLKLSDPIYRFLLAFLSIETILQETTIYRRRQKLRTMENALDLEGAYGTTLGRIKAQGEEKARLGMALLMWISHSRRPLQVDEICHAIAIRIGSNDLNIDDIPGISTLLGCCQGLATVEGGTSTISLIHYTLQEYLCKHSDLFNRAHATIAETCLTYLNFHHVKDFASTLHPGPRRTPFLEYSSLYWGIYMRMELSDRGKTYALQLLSQFDGHISTKTLWKSINGGLPRYMYPGDKPFPALHCVSYFGIAEVTDTLINMNRWDLNGADGAGTTPLIWAARHGHEGVVRVLLRQRQIQPDRQDASSGRTALSWAAGNGCEGVVKLLFGRQFLNPRSIGQLWGKAARAVDVIFGWRYVNPNSTCNYGRTPLSWAASNGHEGIVKLLLGREDVSTDTSDTTYGQTPVSWAAENGHEGVVKLLLELKDVNPDSADKAGRTPLWYASQNGHERTVKLLLGREDLKPNTPDTEYSQTPLLLAAGRGHERIVWLLLGRKDVNPDTPRSGYGQTPLSLAAEKGHEGIVKLLLGREDVNPDTSDTKYGETPLS